MSDIERRYRRLLALFPRDHRERHGDDMVGVLLTAADDRRRPGVRDTVDLVRSALRLHLRRVVVADGGVDPMDALALVGLLGPIAILVGFAGDLHELAWWVRAGSLSEMPWREQVPGAPVWLVWVVVAVLVALRRRRAAMVGAWLGTVGMWLLPFFSPMHGDVGSLLLAMVTTVALTLAPVSEPAPRRQLQLAGAVAAAVVIAVLGHGQPTAEFVGVVVLVVGAFRACGARSRVGRRAAVVLLAPVLVALISLLLSIGTPPVVASSLLVGVPVVVLLALGVLPRRNRLRRFTRAAAARQCRLR